MDRLNEADLNRQVAARLRRELNLTDTQHIYNLALEKLRTKCEIGKISEEQFRRATVSSDLDDLLKTVEEAKKTHNRNLEVAPSWMKGGARWSLQTLERFASAIDVMVQRDTAIAAPVWGSIRVLLVIIAPPVAVVVVKSVAILLSHNNSISANAEEIARDIFDTYERLTEIVTNIERCLERFTSYLELYGRREILVQRLVDFYYEVIQFSLEARVAYDRGKRRILGASIWKSVKQPFERLLMSLKECAEEVDKVAILGHMGETREVRSLIRRQRQQNAPSTSPRDSPNFFAVPDLLSKNFIGRQGILADLHKTFSPPPAQSTLRKAAVWGVPGVGKSQILYRYASINRTAYSNVFHIRAEGKTSILSDYLTIAKLLSLPAAEERDPPERLVVEAVKNWLSMAAKWLLLFDNVVDVQATRPFLPMVGNGDVLFSMRDKNGALSLADEDCAFEVEPFQSTATLEMSCRLLGLASPDSELRTTADELHHTVGGLPIAIEQTVVLCGRRRENLLPLVRELQQRRQQVLDQSNPLSYHETYNATSTLFQMATEKLMRDSPQAAALMKVLIFLDTSAIPITLLMAGSADLSKFLDRTTTFDRGAIRSSNEESNRAAGMSLPNLDEMPDLRSRTEIFKDSKFYRKFSSRSSKPDLVESPNDRLLRNRLAKDQPLRDVLASPSRIQNALLDLQNAGLLKKNDTNFLSIHDLIRDINIEILSPKDSQIHETHQVNALCALTLIFLAFPTPQTFHREIMSTTSQYLSHALAALRLSESFSFDTVIGPEVMHLTASTMDLINRCNPGAPELESLQWYQKAMKGYRKAWNRLKESKSDVQIAMAARADFNSELSGGYYIRIADGYERFGDAPQRTLDTTLKLGNLLADRKHWVEADKFTAAAYKGYQMLLGDYHQLTYETMGLRVRIAIGSGNLRMALVMIQRRISIFEGRYGNLGGTPGAGLAATMSNILERLDCLDEALEWRLKSLEWLKQVWGADSSWLAPSYLALARLNRKKYRYYRAKQNCLRAIHLYNEEEVPAEVLKEARCGLAFSLEEEAEYDQAKELWMEILDSTLAAHKGTYTDVPDYARPSYLRVVWNVCRFMSAEGHNMPPSLEEQAIIDAKSRYGPYEDASFRDGPLVDLATDNEYPGE